MCPPHAPKPRGRWARPRRVAPAAEARSEAAARAPRYEPARHGPHRDPLLFLALILRATALFVAIPHASRVSTAGEAASLLFYAIFVYAMAQRRNWARLVFAFLYVTGVLLAVFFTFVNPRLGEFANPIGELAGAQVVLLVLVGAGMICLFLRAAADWYHSPQRRSQTRA